MNCPFYRIKFFETFRTEVLVILHTPHLFNFLYIIIWQPLSCSLLRKVELGWDSNENKLRFEGEDKQVSYLVQSPREYLIA